MGGLGTALAVAVAGPLGAAVLLAAAVLAAAALAKRIDPRPVRPVAEEVREAVELRGRQEELDAQMRDMERTQGKTSVDSTHVSFPVFGVVLLVWFVLITWAGAVEHYKDPGAGFPLAPALRPLWGAPVAALLAGTAAGWGYRRWYRLQSPQRRAAIEARRRAKERRDFQDRVRSVRDAPLRRRRGRY
ncbi:hypothetical protein LO763_19245 [Glycomyces sp. A-F 0318]|uniref:hypothetical protein n=1 Tax=Glycomyces amatae TaxID=2881355 RepID=UPI001E60DC9F|nr:hypothetical protein [Glycomyces amatae]MCD0445747.1 hypothetical protein [Glycomyces amatae]